MPDKQKMWEERYARPDRRIGTPSAFLVETLPSLPRGRALDIASGDGRHSLALARAGCAVTAVDFAKSALTRLSEAAAAENLAVETAQLDLSSAPLPTGPFDVIVKTYFLNRDLFEPMKERLAPGGVLLVETFLIDQKEIGHPRNPAFLLDRGELAAAFGDLEILHREEGLFDTGNEQAYLSRIAARRPAA